MMAFFDRITNESFRRSESGEAIYLPILKLGSARLLPSATDEAAMRRIVMNFYRYAVLIVCPIVVLTNFYLRLADGFAVQDLLVTAAVIAALLLPAVLLVAYLSTRFDALDVSTIKMNALSAGDGPTLNAALFLTVFTVCIVGLALMVILGALANYLNF